MCWNVIAEVFRWKRRTKSTSTATRRHLSLAESRSLQSRWRLIKMPVTLRRLSLIGSMWRLGSVKLIVATNNPLIIKKRPFYCVQTRWYYFDLSVNYTITYICFCTIQKLSHRYILKPWCHHLFAVPYFVGTQPRMLMF